MILCLVKVARDCIRYPMSPPSNVCRTTLFYAWHTSTSRLTRLRSTTKKKRNDPRRTKKASLTRSFLIFWHSNKEQQEDERMIMIMIMISSSSRLAIGSSCMRMFVVGGSVLNSPHRSERSLRIPINFHGPTWRSNCNKKSKAHIILLVEEEGNYSSTIVLFMIDVFVHFGLWGRERGKKLPAVWCSSTC